MGNNQGKEEEIIIKCEIGDMIKQFFKDSLIIWYDLNIDSPENKPFIAQLENLYQVKTFTQQEEALTYIKEVKTTCHVITTAEISLEEFLSRICEHQNVYGVYILGQIQKDLLKEKLKISCVETSVNNLLFKVERNIMKNYEEKASSQFSFAPIFNEADKKKLNILHMYLKVLPTFRDRQQAKNDFLTLCKVLYSDEQSFDFIINLAQNYNEQNILNWFTRQSLFSQVINRCLAISSSDSLQYCRLPLQDLQKAIQEQYQKKSKHFSGLLYKAACISQEEWSNLKGNLQKEIETLCFFATSKDLNIALSSMQTEPQQNVLITILVPKGPNEEEHGFAEIEQNPHQVLFNTRSRFTILEANEQYSQDLPCRHLVLLYGAQGFRKYLTEKNPILKISMDNKGQILCDFCKINQFFFKSLTNPQNHYCQECIHRLPPTNNTPFLCVPVSNNENKFAIIKGCILNYPPNFKIPFFGNQCCQENNHATANFKCTECHQRWCTHCLQNAENCMKAEHAIILERNPFSFWQERMPENEWKDLQVEKENLPKDDNPDKQASLFFQTHEYEKELDYYFKMVQIIQKTKSSTSPEMKNLYWNIGNAYLRKKEYAKALQYSLELLKILQLPGKQDTEKLLPILDNIGKTYYFLKEFSKAEEYVLKALELSIAVKGDKHPSQISYYRTLVLISRGQGKYQKAVEYSLKGLELSKENLSDLQVCCMLLGLSYHSLGDYKKAEEYCTRARDIIQSNPGYYQDYLASCHDLFGQIYEAQGDYKKALEYSLKALEASKNDEEKSIYENSLGGIYQIQGEYDKAEALHSKVLEKQRSIYGDNSIHLTGAYYFLAQVYCYQGEYSKALEYCFKDIEIFKEEYGENHLLRSNYKTLGKIYEKKGEYHQALEYYMKAEELLRTFYGNNHPDTGECYCEIGNIYNHLGEYEKALENQFKALHITQSAFVGNDNHPNLANCYSGLGKVYWSKKDYKVAMNYHLKALNIRKEVHGENHPDVAVCYADMGDVSKGEGDDEKAKEHYLKALEIRKLMLGDEHPDTIAVQNKVEPKSNVNVE